VGRKGKRQEKVLEIKERERAKCIITLGWVKIVYVQICRKTVIYHIGTS
jgi:hypothetical protein